MAIIDSIKDKLGNIIYPKTLTKAIYEEGTNKRLDITLEDIKRNIGMGLIKVDSWKKVQSIVRSGEASRYFNIGDQFLTTYKGTSHVLDVIGINHEIPTDANFKNSLTLQFSDCINNTMFDSPEALHYTAGGLAAGDYYFTTSGVSYKFKLINPVPAGGQLCFPWAYNTEILTTKITSYPSKTSTVKIEDATISIGNTGTQLATTNHIDRCRYGSNNYKESAIKQWLNSEEEVFNWVPKTDYDRPPTGYEAKGFLALLDLELRSVLGKTNKQVARNTVNEGGGQDLFADKVFLLTRKEVYGADEGVVTGEKVYPYYSQMAAVPTDGEVPWRVKNLTVSPRGWWLRPPYVGYSYFTRLVSTTGLVSRNPASTAGGVSPACVII